MLEKVKGICKEICQKNGQKAGLGCSNSELSGRTCGTMWDILREQGGYYWCKWERLSNGVTGSSWKGKMSPHWRKCHCWFRGLQWEIICQFWQRREERVIWAERWDSLGGEGVEIESLDTVEEKWKRQTAEKSLKETCFGEYRTQQSMSLRSYTMCLTLITVLPDGITSMLLRKKPGPSHDIKAVHFILTTPWPKINCTVILFQTTRWMAE